MKYKTFSLKSYNIGRFLLWYTFFFSCPKVNWVVNQFSIKENNTCFLCIRTVFIIYVKHINVVASFWFASIRITLHIFTVSMVSHDKHLLTFSTKNELWQFQNKQKKTRTDFMWNLNVFWFFLNNISWSNLDNFTGSNSSRSIRPESRSTGFIRFRFRFWFRFRFRFGSIGSTRFRRIPPVSPYKKFDSYKKI